VSVYVDRARNNFGRMVMCHMIADTAPPASFPHYDIAQSKRALAVAAGAIDCERRTFVETVQRLRPVWGVYGPGNPAPTEIT
jgi:hypothetical protein